MDSNEQIIKNVSELLFYDSSLKSEWHPVDLKYIQENSLILRKIPIEEFIAYCFNNFPEIYNHRVLLCLTDELYKLSMENVTNIISKIQNENSLNSFYLFFYIYLRIDITNGKFSSCEGPEFDKDEDDIDFIQSFNLTDSLAKLGLKLKKELR